MTHRPRSKLFLVLLLTAGCGMQVADPTDPTTPPGHTGDVDAFLRGLPSWEEVSPPVVEADEPIDAPVELPEEEAPDGTAYRCITTSYSIANNPDEIAMAAPDASVIWPGALLRGESHLNAGALELLALRRERRAPMGISLQGGGILGIRGGVSTMVEQPIGSTLREGINQLVANALDAEVAAGAGTSSFRSVETHSNEQALLSLGFDARYLSASIEGEFEAEREIDQHTLTATYVQRLFTVAVDAPESPADLFAPDVTAEDLQSVGISEDNLPVYIDSVSYGRMLIVSFTSTDSVERMEAALSFAYDGLVAEGSAYAEAELSQTLSTATIEVFALGGPNTGVEALIASGQLSDYFDGSFEINQVEPISFTVRNLGDNQLASVGSTTEYERRECEEVAAELPMPSHWWRTEGNLTDETGTFDLAPLGSAPGYSEGRYDRSVVFNGGLDTVAGPQDRSPVPTNAAFTISAWVRPTDSGEYMTIASLMGSQRRAGDFLLRVLPDASVQFVRRAAAGTSTVETVRSAGNVVPTGRWSHVTAVYGMGADAEASLRVYVDGILVTGTPGPSNYGNDGLWTMFTVGGSEWKIGFPRVGPRWPFAGSIDELMTFDRALSSGEAFVHYDSFDDYLTPL